MTTFTRALAAPQTITKCICDYLEKSKEHYETTEDEHDEMVEIQDAVYVLFERIVVREHVRAVLFVDIDGVLFKEGNKKVKKATKDISSQYVCDYIAARFFSRKAMNNLQRILKNIPDLALVLSSQWRINRSQYQLRKDIFARWPWFTEVLISKTEDLEEAYSSTQELRESYALNRRRFEISQWLSDHPTIQNFAIIDDVDTGLSIFRQRFVHIDPQRLLRELDAHFVILALRMEGFNSGAV